MTSNPPPDGEGQADPTKEPPMTVDTIAARNKRIKELEDELRRRNELLDAALAEAKQEAADNEADYQGLARLIEEAGYPHLRAMIQALEEAKEFSRRDNQMAAMAEIKIAEARKRAEAAEARVAELERERDHLKQEAEIQAQEMRTHRSSVREILQLCSGATGEAGSWQVVSVVRAKLAAADRLAEAVDAALRAHPLANAIPIGREIREALAAYRSDSPPNTEGEKT